MNNLYLKKFKWKKKLEKDIKKIIFDITNIETEVELLGLFLSGPEAFVQENNYIFYYYEETKEAKLNIKYLMFYENNCFYQKTKTKKKRKKNKFWTMIFLPTNTDFNKQFVNWKNNYPDEIIEIEINKKSLNSLKNNELYEQMSNLNDENLDFTDIEEEEEEEI